MSAYHVAKSGKQLGPFEESEIQQRLAEGFLSPTDLCRRNGMVAWQPIASVINIPSSGFSPPPIPPPVTHGLGQTAPLFLYISVSRLVVMSILSFSVYEMYWIYKNWRYVKERDNLNIRPFWRGWFGVFFCHSLLRRIHADEEARAIQTPLFSPGGLATGWVILIIISNAVSRAPGIAATIIAAFIPSFLCLVPVQSYVNSVTHRRSPDQTYYRWSSGHVVCTLLGVIIWSLLLIGLGSE